MHPVHRLGALLAVVLVVVSAGAPPEPSHPRTFVLRRDFIPSKDPVWGAVGDGDDVATLVEVDRSTHRPLGRSLRLADLTSDDALTSPDRRMIAVGFELGSLAVAYHPLPTDGTAPAGPPHRTGTVGPQNGFRRQVHSLGGGRLAVSGIDSAIAGTRQADRPAGLRIIDTASWTARLADPGVSGFDVAGDTVLASTIAWDAAHHEWAGYKLAAFDPDGRTRYRRYPQRGHRDLDGPSWGTDGDHVFWRAKAPFVGTSERRVLREPRTGAIVRHLADGRSRIDFPQA